MQRQKLKPAWEEMLRMNDGRQLWMRPIQPADEEAGRDPQRFLKR